jgi:hypothetical protein
LTVIKLFSKKTILFITLIFIFSGCTAKHKVSYIPSTIAPKPFDAKIGRIKVFPFKDKLEAPNLIKNIGSTDPFGTRLSEKPLKEVIYQGFQQELKRRGLDLGDTIQESAGYIHATLKTFEFSASINAKYSTSATLDIALYSNHTKELIWKETTEAHFTTQPKSMWTEPVKDIGDRAFNGSVSKLIRKVINNPDFQDALLKLSK